MEHDRRGAGLIAANLQLCGQEQGYTIECGEVAAILRRQLAHTSFDLILLDPPYDIDFSALTTTLEAAAGCLAPDGLIVLERATRRSPDVPPSLSHVRDIVSGDSTLTILRRA